MAQAWIEPEVSTIEPGKTLYERGVRFGMGVDIHLDDHGFGLGFNYRRLLRSGSELVLDLTLGTLRDEREQNFQSYYYGEIIPNKYNRILSFPLLVGYKQRIMRSAIDDNFKLFLQGSVGASMAWITPYFEDFDGNGIRGTDPNLGPIEIINDAFSGWDQAKFQVGTAGQLLLSFDVNTGFEQYTSVRIGYSMHYFADPIQVMEPNRYVSDGQGFVIIDNDGNPLIEKANGPQSFFGSPIFIITFGGLW